MWQNNNAVCTQLFGIFTSEAQEKPTSPQSWDHVNQKSLLCVSRVCSVWLIWWQLKAKGHNHSKLFTQIAFTKSSIRCCVTTAQVCDLSAECFNICTCVWMLSNALSVPALGCKVCCLLSSGAAAWDTLHTIVTEVRLCWILKQTFKMMFGLVGLFNQTRDCSYNSRTNAGVLCCWHLAVPWLLIHWTDLSRVCVVS